jgi:acetylornithine deacetylase/succinyl-diaminopimelate desuccinylase-like protein
MDRYIKEHQDYFIQELFALLRQESFSAQNKGIRKCAEQLSRKMSNIGIQTQLFETEGHPIVYGELCPHAAAPTMLVYGHYDVTDVGDLAQWISPPFEPEIRDGRIYARGAGDNKGQLMAQLLAVETYLAVHGEMPINMKFIFEGEEEATSNHLHPFVETNRDRLACDFVYTSDGPMHDSGAPLVLLGVRGNVYVELTARGAKWDNHSGNKGNIVPNPAWRLLHLLQTMRDEQGRVLIEGFYDPIRQPTQTELELIRSLPFDRESVAEQTGYPDIAMDGETYYRKLTMEPTFNICGLRSGYGGEGAKTIIPAEAMAKLDMRLVVDQEPMDIFHKLCRHVNKVDPAIEVQLLGTAKPTRTSADLDAVRWITAAVAEAYEREPILQPSLGGSLPDYIWTEILGVPSIIVPYANADEANHAPNENISIDCFMSGIRCTAFLIEKLRMESSRLAT